MSRLKHCLLLTLAISTVAPLQMAQARDWLGTAINTVTRVRQAAGAIGGNGGNYGGGANYSPPPTPVQTNVSGTVVPAPAPAPAPVPTPTPTPTPQPPSPTPSPGGLVGTGYGTSNYYHASRHGYSTGQRVDQNQYAVVQVNRPQPRNVPRVGRVLTRIDHQSPVPPQPVQPVPVPKFDDVPGKTAKKDSTPTPSPAVATSPIKFDTGWVNKALSWIKI